jgi:signal transduction histidine kinase
MAAHDLRNPLTAILTSSEILRTYSEKLSPERKIEYFDSIKNSVGNMSELLEDLLLISQAETHKLPFEPTSMDVVTFCQSLTEDFQLTAREKHQLKFICLAAGKPTNSCPYESYLDEKLLRHILTNLLSNAIKYSPEGGQVILELTCEPQQVTFRVVDRGIGMPPEYRDKLFGLFERGANVGDIQGTGLGLYIVKLAVDIHRGTVDVQTEQNVGTTFTVTLPNRS